MSGFKKILVIFLCVSFLALQFPCCSLAGGYYAQANTGTDITAKQPQALSSPEEDIPLAEDDPAAKKGSKTWLYILAGVVVVGLIAVVAGGGSSSSSGGDDPQPSDGSVSVSW